jgi:pentatricopeptide repeat protein
MGRKSGASTFDAAPRDFSQKQKRRRKKMGARKSLYVDHAKTKHSDKYMMKKYDEDKIEEMMTEMRGNLEGVVKDLMLPESKSALLGGNTEESEREHLMQLSASVDPDHILTLLREETQFVLLPESSSSPSSEEKDMQQQHHSHDQQAHAADLSEMSISETLSELGEDHGGDGDGHDLSEDEINIALGKLVLKGRTEDAGEVMAMMRSVGIEPSPAFFNVTMAHLSVGMASSVLSAEERDEKSMAMLEAFDLAVSAGVEPDEESWGWHVYALAHSSQHGPHKALAAINRLKGLNVEPVVRMYNGILESHVLSGDADRLALVEGLWGDMHAEPGLRLDQASFLAMLKHCAISARPEKAFFYLDEIKGLGIEPGLEVYSRLIRACAEAPHWVPGYGDIIFDALYALEGAELEPTVEVYNNLIHAFGKAGDSEAAEYYYWEMCYKGLQPTTETCNNLLNAYAKSQSVGARSYGRKGRYVKPKPRAPTEEEQAIMDVGPDRMREMMSEGLYLGGDGSGDRKAKHKGRIGDLLQEPAQGQEMRVRLDILDGDEQGEKWGTIGVNDSGADPEAALMEQVHWEARRRNLAMGGPVDPLTGDTLKQPQHHLKQLDGSGNVMTLPFDRHHDENEDEYGGESEDDVDIAELANNDPKLAELLRQLQEEDGVDLEEMLDVRLSGIDSDSGSDVEQGYHMQREGNDEEDEEEMMDQVRAALESGELDEAGLEELLASLDQAEQREEENLVRLRSSSLEGEEEEHNEQVNEEWRDEGSWMEFADPYMSARKPRLVNRHHARHGLPLPFPEEGKKDVSENALSRAAAQLDSGMDDSVDDIANEEDKDEEASLSALLSSLALDGEEEEEDVDEYWDLIEFGRAPDPDYSKPLPLRQAHNRRRAQLLYERMVAQYDNEDGGTATTTTPVDEVTLTCLLSVFSESLRDEEAEAVLHNLFPLHDVQPTALTYRSLIRMYVRRKEIGKALALKDTMLAAEAKGAAEGAVVVPCGVSWGLMIESLTHREDLKTALLTLEEATSHSVVVPEKHLRHLRARCINLGIEHPDLPRDPVAWARHMKAVRKKNVKDSQRKVQGVKSALFS